MNHHAAIETFLSRLLPVLDGSIDDSGDWEQEKRAGALALRQAISCADSRPFEPSVVPVVEADTRVRAGELASAFADVMEHLPWTPSFRSDDGGRDMALCTLNDVLTLEPIRAGFVYVGANCAYPEHHHAPQEMYLILKGEARWRHGGGAGYETLEPGVSIYNPSDSLHGVVAGSEPVVALYVLWGMQA